MGQSTPTQPMRPAVISPILLKIGEWMKRDDKNNPPKILNFSDRKFCRYRNFKIDFLRFAVTPFFPQKFFFRPFLPLIIMLEISNNNTSIGNFFLYQMILFVSRKY